jgi:hypothetical protein
MAVPRLGRLAPALDEVKGLDAVGEPGSISETPQDVPQQGGKCQQGKGFPKVAGGSRIERGLPRPSRSEPCDHDDGWRVGSGPKGPYHGNSFDIGKLQINDRERHLSRPSDREPLLPAFGGDDITTYVAEEPFIGPQQIDFIVDHEHWTLPWSSP